MTSITASPKLNHPAFTTRDDSGRALPRRGDIWFIASASGDPDLGEHRSVGSEIWSDKLAVVVSNNRMNGRAGFVQVVYLSTAARRTPNHLHPQVDFPGGAVLQGADTAVAFCEQVHSVDASRLREFHGQVHRRDMADIEAALRWSLGITATRQ